MSKKRFLNIPDYAIEGAGRLTPFNPETPKIVEKTLFQT